MERDEKMIHQEFDLKRELAQQAGSQKSVKDEVKLTKNMTIPDMVKVMMPEIKKALPTVLTPERFTRIALSALNNTPALQKCTPMSFLAALMNAAQIGYKGLIDLAYRNGQMQTIQAQAVYENDEFSYEYGLEPKLFHRPAFSDRGELVYFYGIFRTVNGGYGMAVMSKADMDIYAKTYSKAFDSDYSPWRSNYEEMAKKTVIKQALKYAPIKTDFQRALSTDETIKKEISIDMSEVQNEVIDAA